MASIFSIKFISAVLPLNSLKEKPEFNFSNAKFKESNQELFALELSISSHTFLGFSPSSTRIICFSSFSATIFPNSLNSIECFIGRFSEGGLYLNPDKFQTFSLPASGKLKLFLSQ